MARVRLIDKRCFCPKCGHNTVRSASRQVCEDACEMWFECAECGHDPSPTDHVETVWGWQDEYAGEALRIWKTHVRESVERK